MYVSSEKEDQELAVTYPRADWIIRLKSVFVNCWDLGNTPPEFPLYSSHLADTVTGLSTFGGPNVTSTTLHDTNMLGAVYDPSRPVRG